MTEFRDTSANDRLTGTDLADRFVLELGGNDTVIGAGGNDHITSNDGDDAIFGGDGDDAIFTFNGGNNLIFGGAGRSSGNDYVWDRGGNDQIFAGFGNDTVRIDGGGTDVVGLSDGNDVLAASTYDTSGPNAALNITAFGRDGNDQLGAVTSSTDSKRVDAVLYAGTGDDSISADSHQGGGFVIAGAGDGDDFIYLVGNGIIYGGAGNDRMEVGAYGDSSEVQEIWGGPGIDEIAAFGMGTKQIFLYKDGDGTDGIDGFDPRVDVLDFSNVKNDADGKPTVTIVDSYDGNREIVVDGHKLNLAVSKGFIRVDYGDVTVYLDNVKLPDIGQRVIDLFSEADNIIV